MDNKFFEEYKQSKNKGLKIGTREELSTKDNYIEWLENKIKNLNKRSESPHPLLAEVRAILGEFVDGEYRIYYNDSMDQNTGMKEDLRNLYKKVSEHFR